MQFWALSWALYPPPSRRPRYISSPLVYSCTMNQQSQPIMPCTAFDILMDFSLKSATVRLVIILSIGSMQEV